VNFFNSAVLKLTNIDLSEINPLVRQPLWIIVLIGFLVRDFVQWWTHRLLHRVEWLWQFHKVHHSVKEMGFAAHLRYHWMETVVYRSIEYLPLALLGIGLYDFFAIHIFALTIGHYNHSNISVSGRYTGGILALLVAIVAYFGLADFNYLDGHMPIEKFGICLGIVLFGVFILGSVMKYIFNSPEMHIWHHAHDLPDNEPYGINFGISLAIWDYIFRTNYIPYSGRDILLGFPGDEKFPDDFIDQAKYGILEHEKVNN